MISFLARRWWSRREGNESEGGHTWTFNISLDVSDVRLVNEYLSKHHRALEKRLVRLHAFPAIRILHPPTHILASVSVSLAMKVATYLYSVGWGLLHTLELLHNPRQHCRRRSATTASHITSICHDGGALMFGVTRRDEEFYLIQSLKTREKTTKKRNKIQVWRSHVKGKGRQALFLFDLPSLDAAVLHLLSPLARSLLPLSSLSLSLFSVSRVGTRFSNERTFVHPMFHMFLFKRSNRNFQKRWKIRTFTKTCFGSCFGKCLQAALWWLKEVASF